MASSVPEIDFGDADDFEDQSPVSTLTRGTTLNHPSSPESKELKKPFFDRLRQSFTGKDKKKEQLAAYKQRVDELEAQLHVKNEQLLKLAHYVQSNPFHVHVSSPCRDVNVGNTNQLLNIQDEESFDDIKRLIEQLTSAVHENIEKRASLEMALRGHENMLEEMRAIVKNISYKQEEYHSEDSIKFGEIQHMLQCLDIDVSEENIIVGCVDELKPLISDRHLFIDKFEDIPNVAKNTQRGIIRLVHKFGSKRWFEFADTLDVGRSSVRIQADDTDSSLDRDKCTKIIVEWVKKTNNSGSKLVNIIKQMDQELSKDMVRSFTKEAIMLRPVSDDISSMTSRSSDISQVSVSTNGARVSHLPRFESQQLAGMRNQTAHIIEICKFVEEMSPKIEESHRILKQWENKITPRAKPENMTLVRKSVGEPIKV